LVDAVVCCTGACVVTGALVDETAKHTHTHKINRWVDAMATGTVGSKILLHGLRLSKTCVTELNVAFHERTRIDIDPNPTWHVF
jgi:hypothetical protein